MSINTVTTRVRVSATVTDSHIAELEKIAGNTNMHAIWKTNVLRKDMAALTGPLFSAVKNAEPNTLNPEIK